VLTGKNLKAVCFVAIVKHIRNQDTQPELLLSDCFYRFTVTTPMDIIKNSETERERGGIKRERERGREGERGRERERESS